MKGRVMHVALLMTILVKEIPFIEWYNIYIQRLKGDYISILYQAGVFEWYSGKNS
jgi:uncharacterized membrane protein YcfT